MIAGLNTTDDTQYLMDNGFAVGCLYASNRYTSGPFDVNGTEYQYICIY